MKYLLLILLLIAVTLGMARELPSIEMKVLTPVGSVVDLSRTDKLISIQVNKPGSLDSIWRKEKTNTTHLLITGDLNGSDITALFRIARENKIKDLDLKDACIVSGGGTYWENQYGSEVYYTSNYEITPYMFSFDSLETITLPKKTRGISQRAFSSCQKLKTCIIPSTALYRIDRFFYYDCPNLTIIKLSADTPPIFSKLDNIGITPLKNKTVIVPQNSKQAYQQSPEWRSGAISEDFELIRDEQATYEMLKDTTCLVHVDKPGQLESLLGEKIYIVENLTISGNINQDDLRYLRKAKYKLISIDLSKTNIVGDDSYVMERVLPKEAFMGFEKLKKVILPDNLMVIERCAFENCGYLESIKIPETVERINRMAFYECVRLQQIEIPEKVVTIEEMAFNSCHSLKLVVLPSRIEYLSSNVFRDCPLLTDITCRGKEPMRVSTSAFSTRFGFKNDISNLTLHVPKGSAAAYKKAPVWGNFKTIVETEGLSSGLEIVPSEKSFVFHLDVPGTLEEKLGNNIYHAEDLVLSGNLDKRDFNSIRRLMKTLKSIDLSAIRITDEEGKVLYDLPDMLFSSFDSLESVKLPDWIQSIGDRTFGACQSLLSIKIPGSVTKIGASAFSGCYLLTEIDIPEGVTEIGEGAFSSCKSLLSITIPEGVTVIGENTFYSCGKLKSANLPRNLTSIGGSAFRDCHSLISITIPYSVTKIEEEAFAYSALESIELPESVRYLSHRAFMNCTNLQSVKLSGNLDRIEFETFSECSRLKSIVIPERIKFIDYNAFYKCTSLKKLVIMGSLLSVGFQAFTIAPLTEIRYYGNEVFRWDKDIFHNYPNHVYYWDEYYFNTISKDQVKEFFMKSKRKLFVPEGLKEEHESAKNWGSTKIKEDPDMIPSKPEYKSLTIHVKEAGTLELLLKDIPNDSIEKLTLTGFLNFHDIWAVRRISQRLYVLDLGQTCIIDCDKPVILKKNEKLLYSKRNLINLELFEDGFRNLIQLTFPTNAEEIEQISLPAARVGADKIAKTINIPSKLISISSDLFDRIRPLKAIRMEKEIPPDITPDLLKDIDLAYCRLYVPIGSKSKYQVATGWKNFSHIIEDETLNGH